MSDHAFILGIPQRNVKRKNQLTEDCRLKINILSNARLELVKLQRQALQEEMNQKQEEHNIKMEHIQVEHALRAEQLQLQIKLLKKQLID